MPLSFRVLAIGLILAAPALAQKPHGAPPAGAIRDLTTALPKNFTREFENEWVEVTRTHYDANSRLPAHVHTAGITVYLYLNASDGVVYSHIDGDASTPRRPVVAGGIRIADTTPEEYHTVVNNAATPSDFMRVLLKTQTTESNRVQRVNGRLRPVDASFDHALVRVNRINVPPHTKTRVEAANYPVFRMAAVPGYPEWKMAATGAYRFLEKGTTEEFENTGDLSIQLITIELKSKLRTAPK